MEADAQKTKLLTTTTNSIQGEIMVDEQKLVFVKSKFGSEVIKLFSCSTELSMKF